MQREEPRSFFVVKSHLCKRKIQNDDHAKDDAVPAKAGKAVAAHKIDKEADAKEGYEKRNHRAEEQKDQLIGRAGVARDVIHRL